MRVLLVNKFYRRSGGAETVVFQTEQLLRDAGHETAVFAMEHEENVPARYERHFARRRDYVAAPLPKRMRDTIASVYSLDAARRLRRVVREFQPDVAHLHNIYHQLTTSVIDVLCGEGVPIVLTLHDYKPVCPNYQLLTHDGPCLRCLDGAYHNAVRHRCVKGSRAASAVAALEAYLNRLRRQYDKVDLLVSPSEFLKTILVSAGYDGRRIVVVPNAVDVRIEHRQREDVPTFVYAGRLAPEKGLHVLLDAAGSIATEMRLVLIGSGPLEEELRARSRNERLPVELAGRLSWKSVQEALATATAAVLPALWFENCPMLLVEAGAHATPAVASRIGGIPEIVDDGRTGLLVPPEDADALASALTRVALDREEAEKLGAAARLKITSRHAAPGYRDRILDCYSSVTAEAQARPLEVIAT